MGSYTNAPNTSFSITTWLSGEYSALKEKWVQENFGLRNHYVRLNNQVNWVLFRKPQAQRVLTGKSDYMYEFEYIAAYYGRDFVGTDSLDRLSFKLKKLQDTLGKINKLILPVLALGKASFYPEYIPDDYKTTPGVSNYIYLREKFKHDKALNIDFNRYFLDLKHTSRVPLYPQYGIHWSQYAALLAFDSLVKYSQEKLRVDLPDLKVTGFEMSEKLRENDFDLGEALNLRTDPYTFWMGYPRYTVNYDSTKHKKLNLLVVGDSFWFQIYNSTLPAQVFNHRFWFYNEQMFPESKTTPTYVSQVNAQQFIREADIILIIHSEATMNRFGSGFIHSCYRNYFPGDK